ncbi:MAG: hypothetical protein AAF950_11205 [Pseudomonadota bacterium]
MTDRKSETTDYWKLPKSGRKVTVSNSAWTWTAVSYVVIAGIAWFTATQNGFQLQGGWGGPAILAALLYPAYRIGSMMSRFLKQRAPLAADKPLNDPKTKGKQPATGSLEDRMAKRRARVAKAKEEGKL